MPPSLRLAAFAATLAVVFGAAALAGAAIGPDRDGAGAAQRDASPDAMETDHGAPAGGGMAAGQGAPPADPGVAAGHGAPADDPVRGLSVAAGGLRLVVDDAGLRRGRPQQLRLRIVDERGRTVRDFDVEHERRMHVIVVRRDLSGFQHLHPRQRGDGAWTVPVRLPLAGSYRLFADFAHDGRARTLASDLRVDGDADLRPLPAAVPVAVSDGGLVVRLEAPTAPAGREAALRFTVTRGGQAVETEPYLGAGGHLVALRDGDLAFLHVHPTERGHGAAQAAGGDDAIGFEATFPTTGRYRLFLQFRHEGRVHTAAFTHDVA